MAVVSGTVPDRLLCADNVGHRLHIYGGQRITVPACARNERIQHPLSRAGQCSIFNGEHDDEERNFEGDRSIT